MNGSGTRLCQMKWSPTAHFSTAILKAVPDNEALARVPHERPICCKGTHSCIEELISHQNISIWHLCTWPVPNIPVTARHACHGKCQFYTKQQLALFMNSKIIHSFTFKRARRYKDNTVVATNRPVTMDRFQDGPGSFLCKNYFQIIKSTC